VGLVSSQEQILTEAATTFMNNEQYDQQNKLVVVGHADVRGLEKYNMALSELCRCQCSCTWEHADGSLRPGRVAVTTPLDSPSACRHLGNCQHIDIGSETHERATATMLFLSVASRRVHSGPSNALHLQRKATSQSRGSGIDASKRHTKEHLSHAINKSSLRQGARPVCKPSIRHRADRFC
jgi:hypothetical protein